MPIFRVNISDWIHQQKLKWMNKTKMGLVRDSLFKISYQKYFTITSSCSKVRVIARAWDYGDLLVGEEVFREGIYDFVNSSVEPAKIIDIGGHIGFFSKLYKHRYPGVPIVVFEPHPENFSLLVRNLKKLDGIQVNNYALSDESKKMRMSGLGGQSKRLSNTKGGVLVEVRRASSEISFDGISSVILKIDTEGEEFKILNDLLPDLPADVLIFVEVHGGVESAFAMEKLLSESGFAVTWKHEDEQLLAIDCRAVRGRFVV